ncbi:hypothetical protein [Streptomyces sp. NPDC051776]|uniref:hypothetical protein n=1 Tax=Streptomyces sp. NPDC051776 TaxID=3155414 RepID=UPI00343289EC
MTHELREGDEIERITDWPAIQEIMDTNQGEDFENALSDDEMWDWLAIESKWTEYAQQQLSAQGIHWAPDTGRITIPDTMTTAQAVAVWEQVRTSLHDWLVAVINETRAGKPDSEDSERTRGVGWVRPYWVSQPFYTWS